MSKLTQESIINMIEKDLASLHRILNDTRFIEWDIVIETTIDTKSASGTIYAYPYNSSHEEVDPIWTHDFNYGLYPTKRTEENYGETKINK